MMSSLIQSFLSKQVLDRGIPDDSIERTFGIPAVRAGYYSKYTGATWRAIFLAQLNVDPTDNKIKTLAEHLLRKSFSDELNAFGSRIELKNGSKSAIIPYFIGNMIHALSHFGYGESAQVRRSWEFLLRYQKFDDGDWTINEFPYRGQRDRC